MTCHGNACAAITTHGVGNAMQFTNNSGNSVKLTVGSYPSGSSDYTLGPHQSINIGGAILNDFNANF